MDNCRPESSTPAGWYIACLRCVGAAVLARFQLIEYCLWRLEYWIPCHVMSKQSSNSNYTIDPGRFDPKQATQKSSASKQEKSLALSDASEVSPSQLKGIHGTSKGTSKGTSEDNHSQGSDAGFVDGASVDSRSLTATNTTLIVPPEQNLDAYSNFSYGSCDATSQKSDELVSLDSYSSADDPLWMTAQKLGYTREVYECATQKVLESNRPLEFNSLLEHLVLPPTSNLPSSSKHASNPSSSKSKRQSALQPSTDSQTADSSQLRFIVIDGSNVAMEHGNSRVYSCKGIELAVLWFQNRGHKDIVVFVPSHQMRDRARGVQDRRVLSQLRDRGVLVRTPSARPTSEGTVSSYDDRFILKLAARKNGVVVSNDHFRDLLREDEFRETIEKRILPFTFYNDMFMPAEDPQGRHGLTLDQLLRSDPLNAAAGVCPYGRKCTYGTKCKFRHPERTTQADTSIDEGISVRSAPSTTQSTISDAGYDTISNKTSASDPISTSSPTAAISRGIVSADISQLSMAEPHSWGPPVRQLPAHPHQYHNHHPSSLPQHTYSSHSHSTNSYPNVQTSAVHSQLLAARTNYHPAHRSHQHYHPTHQEAYYSVPLDTNAGIYLNVEIPTKTMSSKPLSAKLPPPPTNVTAQLHQRTVLPSQPAPSTAGSTAGSQTVVPADTVVPRSPADGSAKGSVVVSGGSGSGGSKEELYKKLSKLFNPQLVRKVMDQNPHITDGKQLRSIIMSKVELDDDL